MAPTILQVELGLSIMASLLLLPLFYFLVITKRTSSHKTKLPPSPPKLPLIGNLHQLGSLPHRSLASLSKKYGPLMLLRLGEIPTLIVSSADMAREVMKTHDLCFASRPKWKIAEILVYNYKNLALSPYGEYWRNVRKLCTVHLLSAKRVQSYHLMREEEVTFMIEKIRQYCSSPTAIDMSEVLYSFANDMICRVVSGKLFRRGQRNELFHELLEENSYLAGVFNIEDYFPWLGWLGVFFGLSSRAKKNFKRWDDLLDEVIEEHEDGKDDDGEEDFVDVLLSLQKGSNLDFELEKDHIKAILVDMFGAGTDTTFVTLEWAMAEIVRNCEVMKKLQDEVRGIVGENRMVREDELNSMTYLKAVVKETLRLHPPATLLLPRESLDDCYIKDYFVPKKTKVFVNGWAINRDPEFWEEPNEFRPERFIASSVDFKGHDFQFIPFGAGRRICPGMQFAVLDIELALANLVHRFEWELPHGLRREDLDMSEKPGFLTSRAEKLHLVAKPCSP